MSKIYSVLSWGNGLVLFEWLAIASIDNCSITSPIYLSLITNHVTRDQRLFQPVIRNSRFFTFISNNWPFVHNKYRVGQSREIYSNSVPLSPPHWPCPKRIRPPSWPRVAVASSIQNTKLFTWRTWPGAGAVPKYDWAARSQCGSKQRRADHTNYIWYVATHGQSVITTELMIARIW